MGIREAINRKPGSAIAVVALVLVALIVIMILQFRDGDELTASNGEGPRSWYTVDDGETWFLDRANRISPFDHEGKKAYRCYVWTCDDGKTTFVSHLERIKDSVRAGLKGKEEVEPWELIPGSFEFKPPLTGDSGWIDASSPAAIGVQTPRCPNGGTGVPRPAPMK